MVSDRRFSVRISSAADVDVVMGAPLVGDDDDIVAAAADVAVTALVGLDGVADAAPVGGGV